MEISALTVFDAQAIFAGLVGEPAADRVATLLDRVEPAPRIAAINIAEVIDVLSRVRGWPHEAVVEKVALLELGGLRIEPVSGATAVEAARLRSTHYHRERRPISISDCVALALAIEVQDELATSDPALIAVAREEQCPVIALPDSRGRVAR